MIIRAQYHLFVACAIAAALAGCRRDPATPASTSADGLAAVAQRAFERRQLPGLAVVVLDGDAVLLSRGYGSADLARQTPVGEGTIFQLGSISKQFLAALVVAMAGDGTLSLEDPVVRHLPGLVHVSPAVRIRHLLSHTSGIRELFQLPGALEAFDDLSRTRSALLDTVRQAPVDFAPGARWSYSNTNYTLLAAIVEGVTGMPYEDAISRRLFAPHSLASLRQCRSIPAGPTEAVGYVRRGEVNVPAAPENMEWIRGDGGFCGTASDLARWTRLLAAGAIVSKDQYRQMTDATRLEAGPAVDYGFALALVGPDGVAKVSHGGAMRGFSAQAAHYPGPGVTVVVLTNRGDDRADAIEREIARAALGLPAPIREAVALSPDERAAFAGRFDVGVFTIRIAERGGQLWLEAPPPGPTTPLRFLGDGRFVSETEPDGTAIDLSADGSEARLYMGAMHWYGTRR
jgi:CubicO group peptidase (beta-lactamase class C family)